MEESTYASSPHSIEWKEADDGEQQMMHAPRIVESHNIMPIVLKKGNRKPNKLGFRFFTTADTKLEYSQNGNGFLLQ